MDSAVAPVAFWADAPIGAQEFGPETAIKTPDVERFVKMQLAKSESVHSPRFHLETSSPISANNDKSKDDEIQQTSLYNMRSCATIHLDTNPDRNVHILSKSHRAARAPYRIFMST